MSFITAVLIRVMLLCALFAGVMGILGSDSVNVRAVCCIVIMIAMILYAKVEWRSK